MGLVAFSLMLVVAAFESRDEKASILRLETFDNNTLNITALVEIALAILIARGGVLTSLLGTAQLSGTQWLIGALPALVLFISWELGKAIARGRHQSVDACQLIGRTQAGSPAQPGATLVAAQRCSNLRTRQGVQTRTGYAARAASDRARPAQARLPVRSSWRLRPGRARQPRSACRRRSVRRPAGRRSRPAARHR